MPDTGSLNFTVTVAGVVYTASNVTFPLTTSGGGGGSTTYLIKDDFNAANGAIAGRVAPISAVANRVYGAVASVGAGSISSNKASFTGYDGFLIDSGVQSGVEISFDAAITNNLKVYYGSTQNGAVGDQRYVRIEDEYFSMDNGNVQYIQYTPKLTAGTVYRFSVLAKTTGTELWINGVKKGSLNSGGFVGSYIGIQAPGQALMIDNLEVIANTGNTLLGTTLPA